MARFNPDKMKALAAGLMDNENEKPDKIAQSDKKEKGTSTKVKNTAPKEEVKKQTTSEPEIKLGGESITDVPVKEKKESIAEPIKGDPREVPGKEQADIDSEEKKGVVRVTISIPADEWKMADAAAGMKYKNNLSKYVSNLIKKDIEENGDKYRQYLEFTSKF